MFVNGEMRIERKLKNEVVSICKSHFLKDLENYLASGNYVLNELKNGKKQENSLRKESI